MRGVFVIVILATAAAGYAQPDVDKLLSTAGVPAIEKQFQRKQVEAFIEPLRNLKQSDQRLLRKTFRRINSTYLKKYEAYSGFNELFTSGRFDCLTATALYSVVLSELNFSYEIIETNYHIFLIVRTSRGEVLIETTDRFGGFITGRDAIARRTADYHRNRLTADNSKNAYRYSFNLYQSISPEKLNSLLYFNQAVKAFNRHDWLESSKMLERASTLLPSSRCDELGALLIQTVLEAGMDEKLKADCLVHLKSFWQKKIDVLASN